MLFYEPHRRDRRILPHDPFKALVTPRPVGWISTTHPDGAVNLAPYSFFNAVCESPLMLAFSSQGPKDSATFAGDAGEFVWNLATYDLREAMNLSSAPLRRGHSEFEHAGLEMAESHIVSAPRVAASPCSMECRVTLATELRDLDDRPTGQHLVVGQVVGIHIDERYVVDGQVDTAALQPIARCGYLGDYAVVDRLFQMPRPRGAEPPGF